MGRIWTPERQETECFENREHIWFEVDTNQNLDLFVYRLRSGETVWQIWLPHQASSQTNRLLQQDRRARRLDVSSADYWETVAQIREEGIKKSLP